ncbi:MAG: hypothetical protein RSE19_06480 [Myroides sp.]
MANLETKNYKYEVLQANNKEKYVLNIYGRRIPCNRLLINSKDLLYGKTNTLSMIDFEKGELQVFLNNELVATHNRNKNKKLFDD